MSAAQRGLWAQVELLWQLAVRRDTGAIEAALHPQYSGWERHSARPHDRAFALASVGPDSPPIVRYQLYPWGVTVYGDTVGVAHYSYRAELETAGGGTQVVTGRWTEVYLQDQGRWLMVAVHGGPDAN
jgi:hypothetical protein